MASNTIEKKVMFALKAKIAQKQKEYDETVRELRQRRDNIIAQAEIDCEAQEMDSADNIVKGIFTTEFLEMN
jgi:hypothetical protein